MEPTVTFIVPCYNLAHLLAECVDSILLQTYPSFEVLIMDDCSPDATPKVAAGFSDPRVRHIRNQTNLGNIANFNKGIHLARGKYIWLISADDRIRSPFVLERYVELLEGHPEVGFVCCPVIKLEDGVEKELLQYSVLASHDIVFEGKQLLKRLLHWNPIAAPAAMARKECYTGVSLFPSDLPYAGDWFMWCAFALHYDVGYFAEPMVNYRHHSLSLTNIFKERDLDLLFYNDLAVLSRISSMARQMGNNDIVAQCGQVLLAKCMHRFWGKEGKFHEVKCSEIEEVLNHEELNPYDRERLGIRIYVELADHCYTAFYTREARGFYLNALRKKWLLPEVWLKFAFLCLGSIGRKMRALMSGIRSNVRHTKVAAIK
ncbi:glycosyltransferase [Geobacter sp. SVR]|uniref:glycosyltransferase family 2 protein n=1 Tax=Geobacter sp. SVR TaxID=2495594 RepID=UPI00143EFB5A|nr:glycosyltransferase [Geobacter sp. SVR]BCS54970.1 hypothetical protein GSVR_32780 [Geobacter sp. SVR]GCF86169.1 hypothetical protein GSbR_27690 [Geobacter sp. SVR]